MFTSEKVTGSGRKDLELERKQASFDSREMNYYIHGGKEMVELREKMLQQFERDPHFNVEDHYDLTKDQQRKRVMTRVDDHLQSYQTVVTKHDCVC
jgi:hypothetical protein